MDSSNARNHALLYSIVAYIYSLEESPAVNPLKAVHQLMGDSTYWNSGGNCMIVSKKMEDVDGYPVWMHISDDYANLYTKQSTNYSYEILNEELSNLYNCYDEELIISVPLNENA